MTLWRSLHDDSLGVRVQLPDLPGQPAGDAQHVLHDEAGGLSWVLTHSPFPVDLRDEVADALFEDLLFQDIEDSARAEMRMEHARIAAETGAPVQSRLDDPRWSPIVSAERTEIDGGPALAVLRRTSYAPGHETLAAELIVPLDVTAGGGALVIGAVARAGVTGLREAVQMLALGDELAMPSQDRVDALALDEQMPDHPLSRTRRALAWLLEPGRVTRTRPWSAAPRGESTLEGPGCAVTAPARFARVELPMAPTAATFVRTVFPGRPHRMLQVFRVPERVTGGGDALVRLARRMNGDWAREGAADIETDPRLVAALDGRPQVEDHVRFVVGGAPLQELQRWLLDPDGVVFRIGASGPRGLPVAKLVRDVEDTLRSWRRLDAVGPPAKPWWKLW